jgi:hypothetical protein
VVLSQSRKHFVRFMSPHSDECRRCLTSWIERDGYLMDAVGCRLCEYALNATSCGAFRCINVESSRGLTNLEMIMNLYSAQVHQESKTLALSYHPPIIRRATEMHNPFQMVDEPIESRQFHNFQWPLPIC